MLENSNSSEQTEERVFKPKAILFGFHGVIAPIDWEDSYLPYIKENLLEYLTQNWNNNSINVMIAQLRQESFDQHFVYEHNDCPVIAREEDSDLNEQIKSVNDFIIWQMNCERNTAQSLHIQRMVWLKGVEKEQIKVNVFEDVVPALKKFRESKIKIALFSTVDQQLCRQLLSNTSEGDLNQYFDQIFDKRTGDSKQVEAFKSIANTLSVKETDILYIIDSGQSAKCAKQLEMQCLLIIRPNNRKLRAFYLIRFNTIYSLLKIVFVERK